MKTTTYQNLINSKTKYDAMLARLDIKNKKNRWDTAYELVNALEVARLNDSIGDIDSVTLGRMRFALTDLDNMNLILDQFSDDESILFKHKFSEILKGAISQVDEISTGSGPRDIQLELLMCAKFRKAGLDAQLGNPHPDILVRVNGKKYGFECKRIFNLNQSSVQKNIEKAISQLNDHFLDKDYSKRGLPLLCIDKFVTGGDKILSAQDESSARSFLGDQIQEFISKYYKRWNGSKIKDGRIIGVMIFMNVTAELKVEGLPVVCHQVGASNNGLAGWSKDLFNDFVVDIASLMGPMDYSKLECEV